MFKNLAILLVGYCFYVIVTSRPSGEKVTPPPSGIYILDGICMAKRTDRLVYRHRNETHIYIAFDILKKGKVLVYSWQIYRAANTTFISPMKEEILTAVDFRKTVNRNHILGATGKRHFKKFRSRLRRKVKGCEEKHICKIRSIINVFVRLKVRNVSFNTTAECDIL